MNRYLKVSLFFIFVSLCIHIYLSFHFYQINFGHDITESSCNINATFNCDTVALSPFSRLMGIPISLFGGLAHIVLLIVISLPFFRLSSHPQFTERYSLWLSIWIACVSVIMFAVSITQLSSHCIYCLSLYVLSFLTVFTLWKHGKQTGNQGSFGMDIKGLFTHLKAILFMILIVPVFAFILHHHILKRYMEVRPKKVKAIVQNSLITWKSQPKIKFSTPPSLIKGSDASPMTVVEFADFLCVHCKKMASVLKVFFSVRPDVRFEFYNFPLGGCPEDASDLRGRSCQIAKAIHCSAQQRESLWDFHNLIFENQDQFLGASFDQIYKLLQVYSENTQLDWEEMKLCMDTVQTHQAILSQIEEARRSQVKSTPSVYVNGQRLRFSDRYLFNILLAIYGSIKD